MAGAPEAVRPSSPLKPAQEFSGTMGEEEWVEHLDNLLSTEEDNATTTRRLLATLPALPTEAQQEYVAHAVNLCEDENYAQLENVYLTTTVPAVVETIFDDALNRPDELKLPMLAKTLRNPAHPMAGESREILEMYLDLEPGDTPAAGWEVDVQQYLQDAASSQ